MTKQMSKAGNSGLKKLPSGDEVEVAGPLDTGRGFDFHIVFIVL